MYMKYWLLKSEPHVFSIDDLKKNKKEVWTGVRNYQARNTMRDLMAVGDICFFYHSSCDIPAIAGLCKVSKTKVVDETQFDKDSEYYDPKSKRDSPTWVCVEVEFVEKFATPITLSEIKKMAESREEKYSVLKNLPLIQKGSRLSVQPVTAPQAKVLLNI